jgi:metal-responsive CopG/Arc/MetJ family transcriptional regulator
MAVSTVNISFHTDLLRQIDTIAKNEARTRSELIREATRLYIERKRKWESIYAYGESIAAKNTFTEDDVMKEIKQYRKEKRNESRN